MQLPRINSCARHESIEFFFPCSFHLRKLRKLALNLVVFVLLLLLLGEREINLESEFLPFSFLLNNRQQTYFLYDGRNGLVKFIAIQQIQRKFHLM